MDKKYFNPCWLQLRPDISFLDGAVSYSQTVVAWKLPFRQIITQDEELVGNDFLAVNKILFLGGSLQ